MIGDLFPIFITLFLVGLGFSVGGWRERSHFKQLDAREAAARDIRITNLKTITHPESVLRAEMVSGNVVIATDYFKTLATVLRNLVGGEMVSAQRLLIRARREALARLVDEARAMGATEIWNLRFQFCNVGQMSSGKGAMSVEMYAYATAVVRKDRAA